MSDIESYDGLCGNIPTFANSNLRIRCKYDLNHRGPCSYEKYRNQFTFRGGSIINEITPEEGFNLSVKQYDRFNHRLIIITSNNQLKSR